MSAFRRVVSGSSASMVGLALNLVTQVGIVPLYLSFWDQRTYGAWLALQGVIAIATTVDVGHQDFVGFECLRTPVADRASRTRVLSAALPFAAATSLLMVTIIVVLHASGLLSHLLSEAGPVTADSASIAALILAIGWLAGTSLSGLLGRVMASIGQAPRTAWLSILQGLAGVGAQVVAIVAGAGIIGVAVAQTLAVSSLNIIISIGYYRRLKAYGVLIERPNVSLGFRNFTHSFALTFSIMVETMQQTGFRVVLVPLLGPVAVAQFSTLRTVANTAQQGIGTLVNPVIPELMRATADRNKANTKAMLSLISLLAVILVSPGIILLQLVGPLVYAEWTRGKIPWDGTTFALLTLSIVVSGLGQPSRGILRGNNLLRSQIAVSVAAGAVLLGGSVVLVPRIGLAGSALSLMAGEGVRALLTTLTANRWLRSVDLSPPLRALAIACGVAGLCSVMVILMATWPSLRSLWVSLFVAGWMWGVVLFWQSLEPERRGQVTAVLRRFRR